MNKVLQILDRYEEIRQKAKKMPEQYPVDYTIRLLEAILSKEAGYQSRTEWIENLKNEPESWYRAFIAGENS